MHKVSVKNKTDNSFLPMHVFIDGQPIRAASVNFNQSADTVPTCEIKVRALPDIEALADIRFSFTPKSVQDAVKILRHALITDKEIYNALVASISSALKDLPEKSDLKDVAKAVADRIIGEK